MQDFHISVSQLRKLMAGINPPLLGYMYGRETGTKRRWPVPPANGARLIIISDDEPRQGWVRQRGE